MAWEALTNLNQNFGGNGIVKLWASPNFKDSGWKIEGSFGVDLYSYFYIPSGFILSGGNFEYNFPLKYVNKEVSVTGWIEYRGRRDLQEGLTEKFWHLEESSNEIVSLNTDSKTKLPYLIVPARGLPSFKEEYRFFLPVNNNI